MSQSADQPTQDFASQWISYRPEIKVVDCTIRDGGLMNDHRFTDEVVKAVYTACCEAGVDYMEIGYKANDRLYSKDKFGKWKFCAEDDIRRIVGDAPGGTKLSVMADAERCDYHTDIPAKAQSVVDLVRVACYINQIPTAIDMVKDAHDKGYETTVNLMAVSTVPEAELCRALELLAASPVDVLYVVDSFGSLYSEQVTYLVELFKRHIHRPGLEIGMHAHNNQQLAFGNTIEAIIRGANRVDASIAGLGRGAGNCQMELILGFLHNPKFQLRPILACIQHHIEPLRKTLGWGYDLPYMLTGMRNEHPRAGIAFNSSPDAGNILKFYDELVEQD